MSQLDLKSLLKEIEDTVPVGQWSINGISIWPFVRIKLVLFLYYSQRPTKITSKNDKTFHFSYCSIFNFIKLFNPVHFLQRRSRIMTISVSSCTVPSERGLYNRFMDSLALQNGANDFQILSLEVAKPFEKYGTRYRSTVMLDSFFQLTGRFSKFLKFKIKMENYDLFEEILERNNIEWVARKVIVSQFSKILFNSFIFKLLIVFQKPKAVVATCFYSSYSMALLIACKKRNIPFFDVQHGVISEGNLSYSEWDLDLLDNDVLIPNGFVVWTQKEKTVIESWGKGRVKIVVSGNYWLSTWKRIMPSVSPLTKRSSGKVAILFSMQPNTLPEELINLVKNNRVNCFWNIRVHPQQLNSINEIKKVFTDSDILDGIEIESSSIQPLPDLLDQIDLHVTYGSALSLEAYQSGIMTIFLDPSGANLYKNIIPDSEYVIWDKKIPFGELAEHMSKQTSQCQIKNDLTFNISSLLT
jgi:hypothetical protein